MDNTKILRAFEQWLLASDRMDSTIGQRMRHIRVLARSLDLATLSVRDLEAIQASTRHLADETRKARLASWRVFFGWAHRRGIRPDDPTVELSTIRVRRKMPTLVDDTEIDAALVRASPRDRAVILLGRDGWLRLSEITELHTRQRRGDMLNVRGKGGKHRIVYLSPETVAALRTIEEEQGAGYYFRGGTNGHLHPASVYKIVKRTVGVNPHALRHTGATVGFRRTRNLRAVQEQLGHASVATTQRYTHVSDDERRETVMLSSRRARPPGETLAA